MPGRGSTVPDWGSMLPGGVPRCLAFHGDDRGSTVSGRGSTVPDGGSTVPGGFPQ